MDPHTLQRPVQLAQSSLPLVNPVSPGPPNEDKRPELPYKLELLPQSQPERRYFSHNPTKGNEQDNFLARFLLKAILVEAFRQGYPRFAAFINCDRDFVAFRGFGRLHARVLLLKQDEIIELEQKLQNLDDIEANAYQLASRRHDLASQRSQILSKIEEKLVEYGKETVK